MKTPKSPGNESYESFGNNTQDSMEDSEWTSTDDISSLSKDVLSRGSTRSTSESASLRRRREAWKRQQENATITSLEHIQERGGGGAGDAMEDLDVMYHEQEEEPKETKLQARLASLFSSRATILKKKNKKHSNHNLNVSMDDGLILSSSGLISPPPPTKQVGFELDSNLYRRSKSAPKKRSKSPLQSMYSHAEGGGGTGGSVIFASSSPTRSQTSGASSTYIRWPGTLDKHSDIVHTTSSFEERDKVPSVEETATATTASPTFDEIRSKFKNSPSSPNSNSEDLIPSPSTVNQRSFSYRTNQVDKSFEAMSSQDQISFNDNYERRETHTTRTRKETSDSMDLHPPIQDTTAMTTRSYETDVVDLDIDPNEEENEQDQKLVDLDEIPDMELELDRPADFHLAAVIAKKRNVPSPHPHAASHELNQTFPGALGSRFSPPSSNGTYGTSNVNRSYEELSETQRSNIDTSASLRRVQSVGKDVSLILSNSDKHSSCSSSSKGHTLLTEDALRQNDRMSPLRSYAHGANIKGYRGFLEKTVDVPNLMDDSDSATTVSTQLTEKKQQRRGDFDLDSSDGMTSISGHSFIHHGKPSPPKISQLQTVRRLAKRSVIDKPLREEEEREIDDLAVVNVGGSFSTIQTTMKDFEKRKTSREFDANLTESDTDFAPDASEQNERLSPNTQLPSWPEHSGRAHWDESSAARSGSEFSEDFLQYTIHPDQSRLLVNKYRSMSNLLKINDQDGKVEDSKKAFALFEMRSRIMESDIERGLDRKGGTVVVDDVVTTEYQQAAQRVRDAVIVSKAWRDGASPKDVRTAFMLTKDNLSGMMQLYVNRQREGWNRNKLGNNICTDDIEFSLLRCSSLQSRFTRGFDIFTIGDCQSILLKLTNEQCEVSSILMVIFLLRVKHKLMPTLFY